MRSSKAVVDLVTAAEPVRPLAEEAQADNRTPCMLLLLPLPSLRTVHPWALLLLSLRPVRLWALGRPRRTALPEADLVDGVVT